MKRRTTRSSVKAEEHEATNFSFSEPNKLKIDEFDTSDEEDLRNTVGNIPVKWYEDYAHIGYSLEGKQIPKAGGSGAGEKKGEIDTFLQREEDPDYWRKIFDAQSGDEVVLSEEQVHKLEAIASSRYPEIGYNPYAPFYDLFSSKREIHPIDNRPPDKRSFVPSADERQIVGRMVHAIKMGWMKRRDEVEREQRQREQEEEEDDWGITRAYDLWTSEGDDDQAKSKSELTRMRMHLPAPKLPLPGNAESYRPPPEYLFTDEERQKWEQTEPEKRRLDFIPKSFDSLRKVPFYQRFYEERIERCMDLYLAPRQRKMRLNVDPKDLLPDLPNPKDLQPFPTTLAFYMRGHKGQVRSLSVEPECGELLVSGGEDCTVRVWALPNGNCLRMFKMSAPVTSVQYCPDPTKTLILVSCECNLVTVLNVQCGDRLVVSQTREMLASLDYPTNADGTNSTGIKWFKGKSEMDAVYLEMTDKIRSVSWHGKGDYFATVGFESAAGTVVIHQLSKTNSQKPFTKRKGIVQSVLFHPTKPLFFVGTRQHVLIYDLAKCELQRKLLPGTKWLSCMALHPGGNNLFIGGLDRVFAWLDLEMGVKPWKKLRNHESAIRALTCHRRYPLLASVSDDATAIVYHARPSPDLMRDNELVPVKRLCGHKIMAKKELIKLRSEESAKETEEKKDEMDKEEYDGIERAKAKAALSGERLAILHAVFHPTRPWLITSGADGQIALFSY